MTTHIKSIATIITQTIGREAIEEGLIERKKDKDEKTLQDEESNKDQWILKLKSRDLIHNAYIEENIFYQCSLFYISCRT